MSDESSKPRSGSAPGRAEDSRACYFDNAMSTFPLLDRALYDIAAAVILVLSKLMWRWSFEGQREFLDHVRDHGSVVVMNHVSMVEPILLVIMMWSHHLRIRPVYKAEFDSTAISRWAFSRIGGIPVHRGTADLKAVRRAQHALERGECILIFPEGTRVKTDDQPVEIHGGFSLMAQVAKTDVVPGAVVGARDVTPKGHHVPRPLTVYLALGEPITFDGLGVEGRKARLAAMEKVSMQRVYALRDHLREEHPGKV